MKNKVNCVKFRLFVASSFSSGATATCPLWHGAALKANLCDLRRPRRASRWRGGRREHRKHSPRFAEGQRPPFSLQSQGLQRQRGEKSWWLIPLCSRHHRGDEALLQDIFVQVSTCRSEPGENEPQHSTGTNTWTQVCFIEEKPSLRNTLFHWSVLF